MRLTLRTLLAYLDEILDPADADQLHRKIHASEFATGLVHQIRGSVRRLRLDAPALDAQGIGGDVNTVAEYLDNTLPPEQVPAFEKVCLENEMHLGEVASSHQILTLVLGEAADVTERMRERSYGVAPTVARPALPPLPTPHVEAHPAHPSPPSPVSAAIIAPRQPAIDPSAPAVESPVEDADTIEPAAKSVAIGVPPTPALERHPEGSRSKPPTDVPSTKEAWRAESQQGLAEPEEVVAATVEQTQHAPVPVARPDYLEPRSSWLRSALITAVVALLILLGLMFATRPLGENGMLSSWFKKKPIAVADNETKVPLEPQGDNTPPVEPVDFIEVSEGTSSPSHLDDGVERIGFPQTDDPPQDAVAKPDLTDERADKEITPWIPTESELPASEQEAVVVDKELSATPPEDLPPEVIPAEEVPVVETNPSVASAEQADLVFDAEVSEQAASEVPDAIKVNPTLPPKETVRLPEVPPAPTNAGLLTSRTETPSVPPVTSVAPLIDPDIDLESTVTDPPEQALPTANEVVDDVTTTQLPEDPSVPDPVVVPKLEPAKLKANQLVLAFDAQVEDWQRVDASVPLENGDFLMCLPAFRADIEIGSSIVCSLVGASRLQLGPNADVTLHDGRLLLKNLEANNTQGVRFQNERLEITMAEASGVVAIEANREHVPGTDLSELPHSVLQVHAVNQPVSIRFLGQDYQLEEGQYLLAFDNYTPRVETASKRPTWISLKTNKPDAPAIRLWKRNLEGAENMRVWLRDRVEHSEYNERSLAARCLAELDEFDAIVSAMNDPEQHAYWDQQFDTLRRAVTRGGDTVGKLQLEIEKVHGAKASLVMEMIRGYNGKQLAEGTAAELVKYLDHPRLDHRVLAFQNLKSITGYTQAFRPHMPVQYRRRSVDRWKKRLKLGHVRYTQAPQVVALLESFATE